MNNNYDRRRQDYKELVNDVTMTLPEFEMAIQTARQRNDEVIMQRLRDASDIRNKPGLRNTYSEFECTKLYDALLLLNVFASHNAYTIYHNLTNPDAAGQELQQYYVDLRSSYNVDDLLFRNITDSLQRIDIQVIFRPLISMLNSLNERQWIELTTFDTVYDSESDEEDGSVSSSESDTDDDIGVDFDYSSQYTYASHYDNGQTEDDKGISLACTSSQAQHPGVVAKCWNSNSELSRSFKRELKVSRRVPLLRVRNNTQRLRNGDNCVISPLGCRFDKFIRQLVPRVISEKGEKGKSELQYTCIEKAFSVIYNLWKYGIAHGDIKLENFIVHHKTLLAYDYDQGTLCRYQKQLKRCRSKLNVALAKTIQNIIKYRKQNKLQLVHWKCTANCKSATVHEIDTAGDVDLANIQASLIKMTNRKSSDYTGTRDGRYVVEPVLSQHAA